MKTAHTKGKLELKDGTVHVGDIAHYRIAAPEQRTVFLVPILHNYKGTQEANAAELVKRWNMHEELVELLANIKKDLCTDKRFAEIDDLLNRAKHGGEG